MHRPIHVLCMFLTRCKGGVGDGTGYVNFDIGRSSFKFDSQNAQKKSHHTRRHPDLSGEGPPALPQPGPGEGDRTVIFYIT